MWRILPSGRRAGLLSELHRARRRETSRRCREKQAATGRTFAELLQRVGGDPELLRRILDQEVERGVVDYHSTNRRYVMNGALPADVRLALRDLTL